MPARSAQGRDSRAQRAECAVHVEPQLLGAAESGQPSRSSVAPVLTVPAVPITQNGRCPAARSATPSLERRRVDPEPLSTGICRNDARPSPRSSAALFAHACVSVDPYSIDRARPLQPFLAYVPSRVARLRESRHCESQHIRHCGTADEHAARIARAFPMSSASQRITSCSTSAGAWLNPASARSSRRPACPPSCRAASRRHGPTPRTAGAGCRWGREARCVRNPRTPAPPPHPPTAPAH